MSKEDGQTPVERRLRRGGLAPATGTAVTAKKPGAAAKKPAPKKAKADWSTAESSSKNMSVLLQEGLVTARREFQDPTIMVAGEAGRLILGLPFPSFSLEYLFQSNVLPFGRMTQLVGEEGTCKSGFAAEVSRWFIAHGGIGMLAEHESKYSPDWVPSIIGWNKVGLYALFPCGRVEDWQKRILYFIDWNEEKIKGTAKEPSPGAVYPFFMTVDSIMGKLAKSSHDKIATEGSASAQHALEANLITRFLKYATQRFEHLPTHLILVNHLKLEAVVGSMVKKRNKIGGKCKEFLETYEIEMSKGAPIKSATEDGLNIYLHCYKNSLGITKRKIPTSVRWWSEKIPEAEKDPERPDKTYRQVTKWDWDVSTVDLLQGLEGVESTRAKSIVDLRKVSGSSMMWSKRLGIKEEHPVSFAEVGQAIHANPAVMQELREAFGVKIWTVWKNGIDYSEQRGFNRKEIAKMLDNRKKKDKKSGGDDD